MKDLHNEHFMTLKKKQMEEDRTRKTSYVHKFIEITMWNGQPTKSNFNTITIKILMQFTLEIEKN